MALGYQQRSSGLHRLRLGRTSDWVPLIDWKDGQMAREAAVSEIARRYREWVDIFEPAGAAHATTGSQGGRA